MFYIKIGRPLGTEYMFQWGCLFSLKISGNGEPEQTFAETIFQYKDTWFRIAMGIAKNESDAEKLRLQAATHIKMPSAVPEGYHFTKAEVNFYLQGDVEQCELKKTEKKGGYIYQIFDFPEGFEKYVSGLSYTYESEDGHYLFCQARLLNNGGALFDEEASVKELEMEGYLSAQEVTSKDRVLLLLTEEISPVEPVMDILNLGKEECFQYLKKHPVPFAAKWKTMYDVEDEGETEAEEEEEDLNTFYYISYWWSSDVLSGEELQELAKGMQ